MDKPFAELIRDSNDTTPTPFWGGGVSLRQIIGAVVIVQQVTRISLINHLSVYRLSRVQWHFFLQYLVIYYIY